MKKRKEKIEERGRGSFKDAILVTFIFKYSSVLINLLGNAFLARILTPNDFGIVSMVNVFVVFFSLLSDMGFGAAIIQNKTLDKLDIDSIYSFMIYFGVVLAVIFSIIFYPISIVLNESLYISIGRILSLSLFFNTANIIPNALIMRDEKFRTIGIRTVTISIVGNIIALFLALRGWRYYSLIGQTLFNSFILYIWNYSSTRPRFILKFKLNSLRKIGNYSLYLFFYNVINYFSRNMDNLLIGKFMGNIPLGYYDKAYKLVMYPVQNLTYVINPVLHPLLAKDQGEKKIIYKKYLSVLKILSLLGVFFTIYFVFSSREIILIFFGEQWEMAVTCFKILSCSLWFQMTSSTVGIIYASLNRTKQGMISALIFVPIQIILFIIAVLFGKIEYVALAALVGISVKFFVEYFMLVKVGFGYKLIGFYKNFICEIIMFLVMAICMAGLGRIKIQNILLSAVIKFVVVSLIYLIMLFTTKQYVYLLPILPVKMKNKIEDYTNRLVLKKK